MIPLNAICIENAIDMHTAFYHQKYSLKLITYNEYSNMYISIYIYKSLTEANKHFPSPIKYFKKKNNNTNHSRVIDNYEFYNPLLDRIRVGNIISLLDIL